MDCTICGKPMELRELRPVCESGGALYRMEGAALAYACDTCKTFAPAAAVVPQTPAAETPAMAQG